MAKPDKFLDSKSGLANTQSGNLLILGCGRCVWTDYNEAKQLFNSRQIMCVNDMAIQFNGEPMHHAVSLHSRYMATVKSFRTERPIENITTHSGREENGVDVVWYKINRGGSSGLFAVEIALILGYKKIIICGIPLDNCGHYYDYHDEVCQQHGSNFNDRVFIGPWTDLKKGKLASERIRSMSGKTMGIFGKPTKEWASGG